MPLAPTAPRLSYALAGPTGAPAVVFVNGLGGLRQSWFSQVRALAGSHQVLTYDGRGIGGSECGGVPFHIPDLAADLLALLDHLALERALLVGISMGGRVVQSLALRRPERVSGLVLVATSCGGPSETAAAPGALAALRDSAALDAGAWLQRTARVIFGARFVEENQRYLAAFAQGRAARPIDHELLERYWNANEGFDVEDRLPDLACPTLVIHGADDRLNPVQNSELIARLIPHARLEILDHLGHSPHIEDPGVFNALLVEFVTQTLRG